MIRAAGAAFVLALSAAFVPAVYGRTHQAHLRSCAPEFGVAVLASDSHAQVYDRPSGERRAGIYACMRSGGAAVYLGGDPSYGGVNCMRREEGHCVSVRDQVLAGAIVAYVTSRVQSGYTQGEAIVSRSIRSGAVLHRARVYVRTIQRSFLEWARVLEILAEPDGSVAWLQEDSFAQHAGGLAPPTVYSVFALDAGGFHALTPELPTRPRSLTLVGSTLSWTTEVMRESATVD